MFINRYRPMGQGWGGGVILVWHNFSTIPPVEHHLEHNTLVSWVTSESIILYFSSIIRQTLSDDAKRREKRGWPYFIYLSFGTNNYTVRNINFDDFLSLESVMYFVLIRTKTYHVEDKMTSKLLKSSKKVVVEDRMRRCKIDTVP